MKNYDLIIAGAGLFGTTVARCARQKGMSVLLIDRRPHPGGNIRCERIAGIDVHAYGAHIFHTSDREVWDFVNNLTPFRSFVNSPIANYHGRLFNLPFNMNTFTALWGQMTPEEARAKIAGQRAEEMEKLKREGVSEPRNLEEQALLLVGREIYEILIRDYTEKQWGRLCTELPAFIIRRLPLRFTFDNNYFNDPWQGIPAGGYNPLIEKLTEGCDMLLSTDFLADRSRWEDHAGKILFTGQIDEYFGYRFGHLDYRSLRFETETLPTANYQGVAVMNFTGADVPYTRIIEHKHFSTPGNAVYENPATVITREYPCEWKPGIEPFYPVNNPRNQQLYERYADLAAGERNTLFGGRLASYRYLDMDKTVRLALDLAADNF